MASLAWGFSEAVLLYEKLGILEEERMSVVTVVRKGAPSDTLLVGEQMGAAWGDTV